MFSWFFKSSRAYKDSLKRSPLKTIVLTFLSVIIASLSIIAGGALSSIGSSLVDNEEINLPCAENNIFVGNEFNSSNVAVDYRGSESGVPCIIGNKFNDTKTGVYLRTE
jgi:hypothetical protein